MCSKTEISISLPKLSLLFLISISVNDTTIYLVIHARHVGQILDFFPFTQSSTPPPPYHLSLYICIEVLCALDSTSIVALK